MELGRWRRFAYAITSVVMMFVHFNTCLSMSHHHDNVTRCTETEKDALLAIKADLIDELNQLSTWGTQKDCCRWKRVYCDSLTGHVTQLHLAAPQVFDWLGESVLPFNGKLSPKIIELEHLEYLDLSHNDFNKSQVPALICSLSNLQHLDLSYNEIYGSRIPELIGNLTNLRYLDLSGNSLGDAFLYHLLGNLTHLQYLNLAWYNYHMTHGVELLKTVSHLSSLEYLDLSGINLSRASDWVKTVGNLPNLRNLTLSFCDLPPPILPAHSHMNSSNSLVSVDLSNNHAIGSSIFNWLCNYINTTLEYLDLSATGYYGHQLPYQIGCLTRLRHLDLSDNDFTHAVEFFPSLTHLSSLEYLDLSRSTFNHGSVFDWADTLNQLSNLQVVILRGCQLPPPIISTTTLSDKNNSQSLAYVDLSYNNLTSLVFKWLSTYNTSTLDHLDLYSNKLSGSLPDIFGSMSSLTHLSLGNNQLERMIPKSVWNMSKLETIYLFDNNLEGVISETDFSKLSKLRDLDLSSNNLVLDFYSEWVPPFQLFFLYLSSCKMGPSIPPWLRTQKNLRWLRISNAGISDVILNWFWHSFRDMLFLDLSSNEIKGTLPDSGFEFSPILARVNLSWNQLEGPIPSFFSKASFLDLSHNKFTKLDSLLCSTNASDLNYLDLSSNHISGELSDCWANLGNLVVLDLSNNTISGSIPSTMGSLSSMETLKLDDNMFVGEMPSSLKNCTKLRAFDLGNNELSGPIPQWLGVKVTNLVILILRANHFNGSLPSQLCHLTSIQVLDLSMNNISGNIPRCFNNLTTLAQNGNPNLTISHDLNYNLGINGPVMESYDEEISIVWKGVLSEYKSTVGLVKMIDFSSNRLTGEIPVEITQLLGLVSLNLAGNHLTGQITPEIGKLKSLDSLDLSRNQISGSIPQSLLQIHGLGYLNLSYNNLSGKIPVGLQLQSYEASSFVGNPQLCGIPLAACNSEGTDQPNAPSVEEDPDDGLISRGFYISLGLGFAVGFWGVCGSLIFKRSWRYAYYNFLNASSDRLYVRVALIKQRLKDVYARQL